MSFHASLCQRYFKTGVVPRVPQQMSRFARCLIRPRTMMSRQHTRVQQSRAPQSRSTSTTTTSADAAVLTNLRDLLDSNPAAAEELAKQLGSTVCLGLASSVQKYTHANPESNVSVAPPYGKLKAVFVGSAVPFVGFGIIDNAVMLVAGDQIDMTLGVSLGISTLAAAGLGNLLSDVGGVWAGGAIEKSSAQLGLAAPMLTRAEENHQRTKATENLGSAVGVAVGCLIGMLPLLLIDSNKAQTMKRKASTESIFTEVFEQVHDLLHADRATLFLVSEDKSHLYSLVGNDRGEQKVLNRVNIPIDNSVAGICVLEKKKFTGGKCVQTPKIFW